MSAPTARCGRRSTATRRDRPRSPLPRAVLPRAFLLALLAAGCAPAIRAVQQQTRGLVITTPGTSDSAIFIAPVETGLIVVDLGWCGAQAELSRTLASLDATPNDVAGVLVTHAHRDHIAAWPLLAHAPFYMAAAEADLFLGRTPPEGSLVRLGHTLKALPRPAPGDLDLRTFSGDTVLAFGRDTVRAFAVPGHTAGSTAYLFRGVLFIGDALSGGLFGGLRPAVGVYTADPDEAAASIEALWPRLRDFDVRFVCTAHGRCVVRGDAPAGRLDERRRPPAPGSRRPRASIGELLPR